VGKTNAILSTIALLVAQTAVGQYGSGPTAGESLTDPSIPEVGIQQRVGEQIPLNIPLVDETGRQVQLQDYFNDGKPVVLALAYYECPLLCGETLNGMLEVFNELDFTIGEDYTVVIVSFDPGETPDLAANKKNRFMKAYGRDDAAQDWHFLTGPAESSLAIANAAGYGYEYVPESDEYAHASAIMALTPEGKINRYFFGVQFPPKELRYALLSASDGAIGSDIARLRGLMRRAVVVLVVIGLIAGALAARASIAERQVDILLATAALLGLPTLMLFVWLGVMLWSRPGFSGSPAGGLVLPALRWVDYRPEGDDPVALGTQQVFGQLLRPL